MPSSMKTSTRKHMVKQDLLLFRVWYYLPFCLSCCGWLNEKVVILCFCFAVSPKCPRLPVSLFLIACWIHSGSVVPPLAFLTPFSKLVVENHFTASTYILLWIAHVNSVLFISKTGAFSKHQTPAHKSFDLLFRGMCWIWSDVLW